MGARVDPKNSRRRASEGWRFPVPVGEWWPGTTFLWTVGILLVVAAVGFLGYDFYRFGTTAEQFQVQLDVRGLEEVPAKRVRRTLAPLLREKGRPRTLVAISVDAVRRRLKDRIARFRRVTVRKTFPNRLRVNVEERSPYLLVARYQSKPDRKVYLPADREGVLFDPTAREADRLPKRLPVVRGLEEDAPDQDAYRRKWQRVRDAVSTFRDRFSEGFLEWIHVLPGGYVRVGISRPRSLEVRLGLKQYDRKVKKLHVMMQTSEFMEIKRYVNLSDLEDIRVF